MKTFKEHNFLTETERIFLQCSICAGITARSDEKMGSVDPLFVVPPTLNAHKMRKEHPLHYLYKQIKLAIPLKLYVSQYFHKPNTHCGYMVRYIGMCDI